MMAGVGAVLFGLTAIFQSIIQFQILKLLGVRRRFRKMLKLRDHYVVCGAGRVGSRIVQELRRTKTPFVVIESDQQKVAELIESGEHVLVGDATFEETLRYAGVEHARGLVTCLPDDADNVYVVLIARDLNRDLHIVARAVEEQAEQKLIRAGANRVVAPTIIGSHSMAQALVRPAVADFIDSITAENLDLGFEQVDVAPGSEFVGKALRSTRIRTELESVVVAIRRRSGDIVYHPSGDAMIEPHDTLIVIGRVESLRRMLALARG
jgi:voltage-gated potassium channel